MVSAGQRWARVIGAIQGGRGSGGVFLSLEGEQKRNAEETVPLLASIFGTCSALLQFRQMMQVLFFFPLHVYSLGTSDSDMHFLYHCVMTRQEGAEGPRAKAVCFGGM